MSDYFNNRIVLTDDELNLVMAALQLTVQSYEKYIDKHGHNNLPIEDQFAYVEMKNLHKKLKEKYYMEVNTYEENIN